METSKKILVKKYNLLLDNKKIVNNSSARTRIKKLKKLKEIILKNRVKIKEALKKDFKKNPSEVDLTEIFPVVSEINFTINNLRKWMKEQDDFISDGNLQLIKPTRHPLDKVSKWNTIPKNLENILMNKDYMKSHY